MASRPGTSVSRSERSATRGDGTTIVTTVITTQRTIRTTYYEADLRQRLGLPINTRLTVVVDHEEFDLDDINGLIATQSETSTEAKEE